MGTKTPHVGKATQRSDGRWQVRVAVEDRRVYVYARTRAEAVRRAHERADALREAPMLSHAALAEYLVSWLPGTAVRPVTRQSYGGMVRDHVVPGLGAVRLADLTPWQVQRWVNGMTHSARTIQYAHGVLRKALNDAVALELLPRNPATRTTLPRVERKPIRVLTRDEACSLLECASRFRVAYALALGCGLRLGEVLAVHGSDIRDGVLYVQRSLAVVGGCPTFGPPKTARSRRAVPLPRYVADLIPPKSDLLISTSKGTPVSPRNLQRAFYGDCTKAGFRTNFHALRHTYATWLLDSGTPAHAVSRLLGHASIATTVDIYSHTDTTLVDIRALELD